jgi:hypothetical protein
VAVAAKISVATEAPTKPNIERENSATVSPLVDATRVMTVLTSEYAITVSTIPISALTVPYANAMKAAKYM